MAGVILYGAPTPGLIEVISRLYLAVGGTTTLGLFIATLVRLLLSAFVLLLPVWTLPVSYALPPYWAAVALHASARGEFDLPALARVWAVLLVTAVLLMLVSSRLFLAVLYRARRAGSLALT